MPRSTGELNIFEGVLEPPEPSVNSQIMEVILSIAMNLGDGQMLPENKALSDTLECTNIALRNARASLRNKYHILKGDHIASGGADLAQAYLNERHTVEARRWLKRVLQLPIEVREKVVGKFNKSYPNTKAAEEKIMLSDDPSDERKPKTLGEILARPMRTTLFEFLIHALKRIETEKAGKCIGLYKSEKKSFSDKPFKRGIERLLKCGLIESKKKKRNSHYVTEEGANRATQILQEFYNHEAEQLIIEVADLHEVVRERIKGNLNAVLEEAQSIPDEAQKVHPSKGSTLVELATAALKRDIEAIENSTVPPSPIEGEEYGNFKSGIMLL